MFCIRNENTNPYFNLAAEEYLLRSFSENCFMLYRDQPSIIVGKHQNTLAEINYEFVKKNDIDVIRRLSGGGTVFHDLGNLNFTFIQNAEKEDNLVDFKKYTKPIIDVLQNLGVDARFEGRNDIMINGKKVSGNAEHVYKKRVLHHGTLLFSSALKDLSGALKVNPLKYTDKGVKSVRSRVANINEFLTEKIPVSEFKDKIYSHIHNIYEDTRDYLFNDSDIEEINNLVANKYATWEWNYGYSPKYTLEKKLKLDHGELEIILNVEKGVIQNAEFLGNLVVEEDIIKLKNSLIGLIHEEKAIFNSLNKVLQGKPVQGLSLDEFVTALF